MSCVEVTLRTGLDGDVAAGVVDVPDGPDVDALRTRERSRLGQDRLAEADAGDRHAAGRAGRDHGDGAADHLELTRDLGLR